MGLIQALACAAVEPEAVAVTTTREEPGALAMLHSRPGAAPGSDSTDITTVIQLSVAVAALVNHRSSPSPAAVGEKGHPQSVRVRRRGVPFGRRRGRAVAAERLAHAEGRPHVGQACPGGGRAASRYLGRPGAGRGRAAVQVVFLFVPYPRVRHVAVRLHTSDHAGRATQSVHRDPVALGGLRGRGQHRAREGPTIRNGARRLFPPPPPSVHPLVGRVLLAQQRVVVAVDVAAVAEATQQVGQETRAGGGDGRLVTLVDGVTAVEATSRGHGKGGQRAGHEGPVA